MTGYLDQNEQIYKHLKLRKLLHGEIYTDSVISKSSFPIDTERINVVGKSIVQYQGNISPLVVRQVEKGDDVFYEIIYGDEVYEAAKLINAPKLWVWVVDISDEQVPIIQKEISEILGDQEEIIDLVKLSEMMQSLHSLENQILKLQQKRVDQVNKILQLINPLPKILKINSVTDSELVQVPGIKDKLSQKIIKGRPYRDTQDIKKKLPKNIVNALNSHFQEIVFD
ncbi:ParB N-terminal domain-containing protein [Synechococcus sp. PCC 6312]|uniref:ParB N-terminal domain-containing protein n=1 Tax=Synechococcus sp. (strain ATCC 27167 / PCC 6312) TaxID=195253 RepID=UPI00029F21C6|nr:ParB N-terminal domain-containing protein [Synechococcus sp. PCC 6312]AFY61393.1 hypothetical protein Syn6312_2278 [Synechococcus sp. PCC 6312]